VAFDAKLSAFTPAGGSRSGSRKRSRRAPVGYIDVSFYRDDFGAGLKPEVKRNGAAVRSRRCDIVLGDDVLARMERASGDQ
jgi:pyrimidine operon attenuation protein/uracil phosphoribosyltransferase